MRHRNLLATLALAALVVVAACGDDAATPSAATASTTAPAAFPATVRADQGEVTIDAQPHRIVSLSPSLTELLYAIDAGDQIVAVDRNSDFPAGTPATDLSGFRPNIEAIAGHEPDLVVIASDRDGAVTALTNLGIPTLLLGSPDQLDDVYTQIATLGAATGHAAPAADLAARLRGDLERIAARAPERATPLRYFYELSDAHHTVTSETFIGQVLALAGLESIADAAGSSAGGYPQLTTEAILAANPDVIFLAYTSGDTPAPSVIASRPGWDQITAVRDSHVVVLDDDIASRWGPRLVDLLRAVVDATAAIETG